MKNFMIYFRDVIRAGNMRSLKLMGCVMVMRDLVGVRKVLVEKAAERTIWEFQKEFFNRYSIHRLHKNETQGV